jgi:L-threonylcarbamoyladenylate synthase
MSHDSEGDAVDPEIIKIDPSNTEPAFSRCRDVIARGGIVVYPTDTFYGLGVDPKNTEAVKRLFEIKGRKERQPILLLIPGTGRAGEWAEAVNEQAERLAQAYWPGPLTLVLTARKQVLSLLTGGTGTIGLRVPGSAVTRQLLAFLDMALTGTSANISGRPSPRTVGELDVLLRNQVDLILDGGPAPGGKPSTVLDVTGGRIRVVREGAVKIAEFGMRNSE